MKQLFTVSLLFFLTLFFLRCGGNPEADGDEASAKGNYKQAVSHYMKVKKSTPKNTNIDEKIALSYMKHGHQLFERRKNIKAFSGNFENAQRFIPAEGASDSFNKEYSKMLYELASAYYQSKPSNEIQKEQYFNKTLNYLDEALLIDMDNVRADSLLAMIKTENYQKMFDKGMRFYKQAKKERNNGDLFLSAEHYFKRAVLFDPENEEARKYLSRVRKETMSIPDYNMDFAFVIAAMQYKGKFLYIDFTGFNNLGEKFTFNPKKLAVIDADENEYLLDIEETDKLKKGLLETKTLKARERVDGEMAFLIGKNKKLAYLQYEMSSGKILKKYLP